MLPDQANTYFTAAITRQPKNIIGYRALGGPVSQAKEHRRRDEGHPGRPQGAAGQCRLAHVACRHTGTEANYDGAISEYQYVLTQQPGSLVAANNLASLLADHRTDKASLEQAQSLATSLRKSQVPQFKDTLGWVTYRQGDYKSAVPLLEQAVAASGRCIDPLSPRNGLCGGRAKFQGGR